MKSRLKKRNSETFENLSLSLSLRSGVSKKNDLKKRVRHGHLGGSASRRSKKLLGAKKQKKTKRTQSKDPCVQVSENIKK